MASPILNQERFRGRNDDGSESGATWKTTGSNQNWSNGTDTANRFRVRFVIRESNSRNANNSYILFYSHNSGTYTNLTTSSNVIRGIVSKNTTWTITDGDATTEQLAWAGGGTWFAGYYDDNQSTSTVLLNNQYTEMEYCLYLVDADVNNGDVIDLRVYISPSTELTNYNQVPRITVTKSITKSVSDTGTGTDQRPSISASLSRSDTGTGTDGKPTISASLSLSDSNNGSDIIVALDRGHNDLNVRVIGSENDAHESDASTGFSYITLFLNSSSNTVSASRWNAGMRFVTNIPKGAEIQHSYLLVSPLNLGVDDPNVDIFGELSPSTVDFSVSGTVTNRVRTSGSISWVDVGIGTNPVESPNISSVIQEIVNQPGFDGTITLFLDGKSDSSSSFDIYSYDNNPIFAPLLHVGYHYTITASDTGTGIDARPAISANIPISEIGGGTEQPPVISASFSSSDTGTGADNQDIAASLGLSDGALGGDFLDISASLSLSDDGTGTDNINVQASEIISVSDGGNGSDAVSIVADLSLSDSGTGDESTLILASLTVDENGLGTDLETVYKEAIKSIPDSGSGDDAVSISADLSITDNGFGTDEVNVTEEGEVIKSVTDTINGTDEVSISASLSLEDVITGIDDPTILAEMQLGDDGYGLESPSIQAQLTVNDAVSIEELLQLLASLSVSDNGTGIETIDILDVSIAIYDIFFTDFSVPTISFELSQPVVKFLLKPQ